MISAEVRLLYEHCIWSWGVESQMRQAVEEMAELTAAIHHFCRGRDSELAAVAEEMVDVQIMLEQLQIIAELTGIDLEPIRQRKLQRLRERVGENCKEGVLR